MTSPRIVSPTGTAKPTAIRLRPVFDAHVDSLARMVDLNHDLAVRGPGQLDLARGIEGGLGAVVLVCWIDPERFAERPFERAAAMLVAAHQLAERNPKLLRIVRNGDELTAARAANAIAGIIGIEGGHPLENDLEKLRWLFERGLRVMTLVWNNHLPWVRSCQDGASPEIPPGLSDFGRDVVAVMNEWGILVDVSHAGERSFYDTLDATTKPVIASHSACRALHDHPRNLTDAQLRKLADSGGVVGIVFHPGFLDADARAEEMRVRRSDAYTGIDTTDPAERFLEQQTVMRREAKPYPAAGLVEHILHAVDVAGIDHVGLGSDYDGIERAPKGLEDAACYGHLSQLLLARGLSPASVEKILGLNMERAFAEATSGAR